MKQNAHSQAEIAIIGGGMVGLTQALLLAHQLPAARIKLLEILPLHEQAEKILQPSFDGRSTALSAATVDLLQLLGLWCGIQPLAQPITEVHVSDAGHAGSTRYSEQQNRQRPVGYVIENRCFGQHLLAACLANPAIEIIAPAQVAGLRPMATGVELKIRTGEQSNTLHCDLAVIADGAESEIRTTLGIAVDEHNYQQAAVVANLAFEQPHHGQAFERFTEQGPLAVLPLLDETRQSHRAALVWTRPAEQLAKTLAWPEQRFIQEFQQCFGYRLGACVRVGQRSHYPLKMVFAKEQVRRGVVFVGNAAHFLHPVAGQGFNLAIRDCARLAQVLGKAWQRGESLGALNVLNEYLKMQTADQNLTRFLSHNFIQVFSSSNPALQVGRNMGLLALSLLPGLKEPFFRQMMGLALPRAQLRPLSR